jgi:hypothetical protein
MAGGGAVRLVGSPHRVNANPAGRGVTSSGVAIHAIVARPALLVRDVDGAPMKSVPWLLAVLAASGALACEPHLPGKGVQRIDGGRYSLAWRAVPTIQVGEFFSLDVAVCANPGQPRPSTFQVDAQLPEANQGMNHRASVRPRGPGRFIVEGVMLHLPGPWEFTFDVNVGSEREALKAIITAG